MSPARRRAVRPANRRRAGRVKFPCARCGRPVSRTEGESPRKIGCPRCGYLMYDYPRPCAGFLVVKGDETLLLRRAHPPRIGWYDIPGGFMDEGETIEGAARRELLEETGLRVGRAEFLGFYWDEYFLKGFGRFATMNFYFIARWRSGTPVAGDDAATAEWIPFSKLGKARSRFAWRHMPSALRDARRWARRG